MALQDHRDAIAIVGMSARFPGANDIEQFWQNICSGVESISTFADEELRAAGITEQHLGDPNYIRAAPVIEDVDSLDAAFFGMGPREAEVLDPQHRVFLETCATALQHAGQDAARFDGRIGVFAGAKENFYLKANVQANAEIMRAAGDLVVHIANQTDYLSTGVAYRLNLRGPAVNVVTACSTALVATHLACRALRAGECEMALTGGVEIILPVAHGYLYSEGGILSPDAHIRPFDANARGTVFGSGSGVVVLKRLVDAVADRDTIHAVILGSAINNDGADKGAFSAPSESGQRTVIEDALRDAGVDPLTIGYVEAHGTGTLVGDPVEVAALTGAYGSGQPGRCAIGSVKGNVGHLGAAAGVCGLIKAVHCVREGRLPPSINFSEPNPRIDVDTGPFYVNTTLADWPGDAVRRAGVSSFGIGGTNAHLILEQPPAPRPHQPARRPYQLITISAHTPTALDAATAALGAHVTAGPDELPDVAHTLTSGRGALPVRRVLVARDSADAQRRLSGDEGTRLFTGTVAARSDRSVAFLLPGQGAQYVQMARGLYENEPAFAAEVDRCAEVLIGSHDLDVRGLLFPERADAAGAERLNRTAVTQPALFVIEYALVTLLRGWGIEPGVLAGHSIGEYVAAAVAGVFSVEDGLRLVADRGALMQALPTGSMLAVTLSEELLRPMLPEELDIAAVNAPGMCVVSGTDDDVRRFRDELAVQGIGARLLHTSHAFHSRMMDPILTRFRQRVAAVRLCPPRLPYVSNVTGAFATAEQVTDPEYWARHLRQCVRFSDSLRLLTTEDRYVFVEAGPGRTLSGLVAAHAAGGAGAPPAAIPTMRHPHEDRDDVEMLLEAVGRVWTAGGPVDWNRFWAGEERRRIPLPTYPYERKRYWVEADEPADDTQPGIAASGPYYVPTWRETTLPSAGPTRDAGTVWVVFTHETDAGMPGLVDRLREAGARVLVVTPGKEYASLADGRYTLRVTDSGDYARLVGDIAAGEPARLKLVHAWSAGAPPAGCTEPQRVAYWLDHGFYSVLAALQETARLLTGTPVDLYIVTSGMQDVLGDGAIEPAKAAVLGLVKTAGKEFDQLTCRGVDVDPPTSAVSGEQVAARLFAEVTAELTADRNEVVAYRGRKRWVPAFAGVEAAERDGVPVLLAERGRYLITGGLGGLGLVLAEELARLVRARLVLVGRTGLPDRAQWPALLADGDETDPVIRRIHAVQAVEKAGGEVMVLAGDVTDEARMREIRAEAERVFGGIDGVFHLAAVAGGGMLETRPRAAAEAVFGPKVTGAYVLDRVFEPDLLVFYSSIAAIHGDFGLGDYAGANAVLDAYAQARWAAGRKVFAINFSPWTEVGMAHEIHGPAILSALSSGASVTPVAHPMLRNRRGAADEAVTFEVDLSPGQWVLAEHRLDGVPTMPGTGLVELIRAACAELTDDQAAEIRELMFLRPLTAEPDVQVRAELRSDGSGGFRVTLTGHAPGAVRREYARGHVRPLGTEPQPTHDLTTVYERCEQDTTPRFDGPVDALELGPRWNNITVRRTARALDLDAVEIRLPAEFEADLADFWLHPAVLDSAGGLGMRMPGDGMYLPIAYDRIVARAPLPVHCHSIIRPRDDADGDVARADLTVVDDDGAELVGIEGLTLLRVDDDRSGAGSGAGADSGAAEPAPGVLTRTGEEQAGVSTAAGNAALRTVLDLELGPQVIVCPEGLGERARRVGRITRAALLEQAGAAAATSAGTRSLGTPYVEPQTDTERAVARLWQNALWLDKVGAEDDFFDLGGNSLVAVQLVAEISRAFKIEMPVALLFELRTVRKVAQAIEEFLIERIATLTDDEAMAELNALEGST